MNYHIFPANTFFNSYIEDIYLLHEEKNNVFWVRGNESDNKYLKTSRPITFIGDNEEKIVSLLKIIRDTDKLFISWYDIFIGSCVLKANVPCKLYVYLMGGDFYDDPPGYHNNWLFDKKTLKVVKKLTIPPINFKRNPQNWHKIIREIITRYNYNKTIQKQYLEKAKTIARIDFLIAGPHNQSEIDIISSLYPTFRAKYLYGGFNQNFNLAKITESRLSDDNKTQLKILVGNSADPCNNHIDACDYLKKTLKNKYVIYCPLSYGDSSYSMIFQRWTEDNMKGLLIPILKYMDKKTYIEFINTMDIVVMFHNRQQACGNIIISLSLGKPVFLKPSSPIYSMMKSLGIPNVHEINTLEHLDLQALCKTAQENRATCVSIIQQYFSDEIRLKYLREIIM